MTSPKDVLVEAGRLANAGTPYALATVVRVIRPASSQVGDRAIVTADGRLQGWVGGACSEPAVIRESLRCLADEQTRLVRICRPGQADDVPPDVVLAESTCASEGVVEVLIEPELPEPALAVVGESPAASTLADLARRIGWRVTDDVQAGADAVVIAAMGRGDEELLEAALATPARYVGLVASARRAAKVLESLREGGLDEASLSRVRSPAGLDLGPLPQSEIAVAVLAELVAWRHTPAVEESPPAQWQAKAPTLPSEAVDPVCGMTVSVAVAPAQAEHAGVRYYFCCAGCRRRFQEEPARYAAA